MIRLILYLIMVAASLLAVSVVISEYHDYMKGEEYGLYKFVTRWIQEDKPEQNESEKSQD